VTEWIRPRGHDIAVLFSRRSRDAYAAEAAERGDTYTFTDAWGRPRTWQARPSRASSAGCAAPIAA